MIYNDEDTTNALLKVSARYYQYGERHHLRTDGIIDDETRRIVFEFQQFYHDNFDSNLKPDGYFGKETGNAIHDYIKYELNSRG